MQTKLLSKQTAVFHKDQCIISLDPGPAYTGFVVMSSNKLVAHGVWSNPSKTPRQRREWMLRRLKSAISIFRPQELILEWPTQIADSKGNTKIQSFRNLFSIAKSMQRTAQQMGVRVRAYTSLHVRYSLAGDAWASKEEIAKLLCSKFPELTIYLQQDRRWKEVYWLHMFDALAVAMCHAQEMHEARLSARVIAGKKVSF